MTVRALALFSGGLDSTLAARIVASLGVEVIGLQYTSVFCSLMDRKGERLQASAMADAIGIRCEVIDFTDTMLAIVKAPEHGYGRNMNPCIDCKINMLRDAKTRLEDFGAKFVITGEVVGQRPMSQGRDTLYRIEKAAGLKGMILRPLSARLLRPTIPEEEGWVEREKLLDIRGRGRQPQLELARDFGIVDYATPAGGCMLTDPEYAHRLKDLMQRKDVPLDRRSAALLKIGRHFRTADGIRIVVARDATECAALERLAQEGDVLAELSGKSGPLVMLPAGAGEDAVTLAAGLVLRYSRFRNTDGEKIDFRRPGGVTEATLPAPLIDEVSVRRMLINRVK